MIELDPIGVSEPSRAIDIATGETLHLLVAMATSDSSSGVEFVLDDVDQLVEIDTVFSPALQNPVRLGEDYADRNEFRITWDGCLDPGPIELVQVQYSYTSNSMADAVIYVRGLTASDSLTSTLGAEPGYTLCTGSQRTLDPSPPQLRTRSGVIVPRGGIVLNPTRPVTEVQPLVLYVDADATGASNGSSWADAYTDLQDALAVAIDGDEIWVAQGTYKSTQGADRTATFQLRNGVGIYGGFAGHEISLDERDFETNETVLSGDIGVPGSSFGENWPDLTDPTFDRSKALEIFRKWREHAKSVQEGTKAPKATEDNSYHVVSASGVDSTAVLDGFTIEAGMANSAGAWGNHGGALLNVGASPTLANLRLIDNQADGYGGAVSNVEGSHPTLTDVTIQGNRSLYLGGGLYGQNSSPVLRRATICGNWAGNGAGALEQQDCNPVYRDVLIADNWAEDRAGGIANNVGDPVFENVVFDGNSASFFEGGGLDTGGDAVLTNVVFSGNTAARGGGMRGSGNCRLTNVLFYENQCIGAGSISAGAGLALSGGSPELVNVTFVNNADVSGGDYSGGLDIRNANVSIVNAIFWGNTSASGPSQIQIQGSTVDISFSLIEGSGGSGIGWDTSLGVDLGGNVDDDPMFMDESSGNLRLTIGSPAMNTGSTDALPDGIVTDLDGNARVIGDAVDMGAYELVDELDIRSIMDVDNDQGRNVRINFGASSLDTLGASTPILQYEAYRRIDPLPKLLAITASDTETPSLAERTQKARDAGMISDAKILSQGWDYAGAVPAHVRPDYNLLAPTLADSTEQGMHWSVFFMRAATEQPGMYYDSAPDSGYSIDNLAPSPPEGVTVAYVWGQSGNTVSWDPPVEGDVRYFKIYRGPDPTLTEAGVVATTISNSWQDPDQHVEQIHYMVSAVDFAGNESEPGRPGLQTAGPDAPTRRFALYRAVPNPFNPSTQIQFELETAVRARLSIYDLSGRLVRTLVDESQSAGFHSVNWNGTDDSGGQVSSGVYLYQLRAGDYVATKRIVLLK